MIRDLFRFNAELEEIAADPSDPRGDRSLLGLLRDGGYSEYFTHRLIGPQASAVWSAQPEDLDRFPIRFMAQFFANHGMLDLRNRPVWMTIEGGSRTYVDGHPTSKVESVSVGVFSSIPTIVPSLSMNSMSSGMHVLCIQNE